jgi:hypothetical protein
MLTYTYPAAASPDESEEVRCRFQVGYGHGWVLAIPTIPARWRLLLWQRVFGTQRGGTAAKKQRRRSE